MPNTSSSRRLYANDDGSPTPPCRMCGRPRRRQNIGTVRESLSLYCGPKACTAVERICQRCGAKFPVGPGATKYCPEHSKPADGGTVPVPSVLETGDAELESLLQNPTMDDLREAARDIESRLALLVERRRKDLAAAVALLDELSSAVERLRSRVEAHHG